MSKYILPAEWHPQSCVQLTWPHEDTDWRDYLDDITETFVQIAKAVAHYEPLVIAAKYPELPIRTTASTTPYIIKVYSAANVSTMTTLCLRAVR